MNLEFLQEITVWRALVVLLGVISLDTLLGISIAITRKEFKVHVAKLPQFLTTNVLPYFIPLMGIALLLEQIPELELLIGGIFYTALSLVFARFVVGFKEKYDCLFRYNGEEETPETPTE